jgi:Zn finger protein HypA/HybF involved in hydrogenase expression
MHEYSLVESLIAQLARELRAKDVSSVRSIRLRLGSTMAEEPIRQAFTMLSPGTPFQNTVLHIDPFDITHTCPSCSRVDVIHHDDLLGHVFICPDCRTAVEIDEALDIRVAEITAD